MKIALFKSEYGNISPCEDWADSHTEYARVSEYVDVEFPELQIDEMINNELEVIDNKIEEVSATFSNQMSELKQKKLELLALE